jgi:hypothetical protein
VNQSTLQADAAVAQTIVDHLIKITAGVELDEWVAMQIAVQHALSEGRYAEAIRRNCRRLPRGIELRWVATRQVAKLLGKAMSNLARELNLPNTGRHEIALDQLPADAFAEGTIKEESERIWQESLDNFKRDPLDSHLQYAEVLRAAEEQAAAELSAEGLGEGFGYCHFFWPKKKEILWQRFGLHWQTPAELNPDCIFD